MRQSLQSARDAQLRVCVQGFCCFSGCDNDGWCNGAGGSRKMHAGAGDGVYGDRGMREEGRECPQERVGSVPGVGGEEEIRWREALAQGKGVDEGAEGRDKVL